MNIIYLQIFMGGKAVAKTKKKSCAKSCPPACLSNPKNHIAHERLILAFSAFVIALSGVMVSPTVSSAALTPTTKRTCKDTDGGMVNTKYGTTTITETNSKTKTTRTIRTNKDYCKNSTTLVEYMCSGTNSIARTVVCSKDQICQKGACINRNVLPAPVVTNTSTQFTSNLSVGQPALSGFMSATDGSWCQVHNTSTAQAYCEDSRGVKVATACNGNTSKAPYCGSVYSGTQGIYLNTKCITIDYACTSYTMTCGIQNSVATCVTSAPPPAVPTTTPTNAPTSTPSSGSSTTTTPATTTPAAQNTAPAVIITADNPVNGSSITQAILAGSQIGRFKISNNGTSKITVESLAFTDSGSHTGTSTTYRLYYSDQNQSNFTANTAASNQGSVGFSGVTIAIDGGSYRYVTVAIQTLGGAISGDTFQLSSPSLGSARFSVTETDLGYDANLNGNLSDTISNLPIDGKPSLGTLVKS